MAKKEKAEKAGKSEKAPKAGKEKSSKKAAEAPAADGATGAVVGEAIPVGAVVCEGCLARASSLYCTTCDRTLCAACNSASHAIAVDAAHERVHVADLERYRIMCREHRDRRLLLYCTTCEAAVCEQCRDRGAHRSLTHRVVPLADAYSTRRTHLLGCVQGPMLQRRARLAELAVAIESDADRLRGNRLAIEKETRAELQAILDRLGAHEQRKLALLRADVELVRAEIDQIDAFDKSLAMGAALPADMDRFLAKFEFLAAHAQDLSERAIPRRISVDVDEFPHEVRDQHRLIGKMSAVDDLLQVKDQMIWYLIRERAAVRARLRDDAVAQERARTEMAEWIRLTDQYAASLASLTLRCQYCSDALTQATVNAACKVNMPEGGHPVKTALTAGPGSGQHYFVPVPHPS